MTQEEKIAVLEHEILHILNKHLIRQDNRNHYVWNLANDVAINQYIKGLPQGILCPECNVLVRKNTAGSFPSKCPRCDTALNVKKHRFEPLSYDNFKVEGKKVSMEKERPSELYYDTLWSKIPKYMIEIGSRMTNQQEQQAKQEMGEKEGEGEGQGQGKDGQGQGKGQGTGQGGNGKPQNQPQGGGQGQGQQPQQGKGKSGAGKGEYEQKQDYDDGGSGSGKSNSQGKDNHGAGNVEVNGVEIPTPMDAHEAWAAGSDNKEMAHEKIKDMVQKAVHKVSEKSQGYMPAWLKGLVDICLEHKTITWKSELRRFYGYREFSHFVSTRKRLNRRFGITQPGYRVKRKAHFLVATDSSGSVDDKEFAKFWHEIGAMFSAGVGITHVECDADITHVQPYKKKPPKGKGVRRYGYGGTDFRPVFKFAEKKIYKNANRETFKLKEDIDGIIYCTDGYGSYPTKIPVPTIWVMTKDHSTSGWNSKIGKVIVMAD
jgi:predicted metal-dependent peptidase